MISHVKERDLKPMYSDQVKNAALRVLVGPADGWDSHVMRVVELGEEGYSPKHAHPWPHINYILEGKGILMIDGVDQSVEPGSIAYVPAGIEHQFKNDGQGMFKFICIVPTEGHA